MSEIERLGELQRQVNEARALQTPEERGRDAIAQLRYIASVEPGSYGYLFPRVPPSQAP